MKVLVANIGSTSFKFRLFDMRHGAILAEGRSERIGQGGPCADYGSAIEACLAQLTGEGQPLGSLAELAAVGFKAVHARGVSGAVVVDERVLKAMEEYAFLAPAHNPPYIAAMRAFREKAPDVPAVALFETAFFGRLDDAATTYACPYEWREELGVRRYGFHGASHRFASERARALCPKSGLRHISCHLGGSSSVAAIRDGVPIDVSFGMSPQSGLPQSNRSGDMDPFAVLYVMKKKDLGVDQVARVLACESGLAGVSGGSGDVRDLEAAAAAGNARARLALDMFVHAVRHYLGAFLLELGGVDVVTFSGGIGERAAGIRGAVCRGLEPFGVKLDLARVPDGSETMISAADSPTQVWVIPANEEWIVARAAAELLVSRAAPA
jgi:acetate kinase